MQDFRKLRVWQTNRELTVQVYQATAAFPREERFGLTAQTRSAVVSIGANIAEGCGRGSRADTLRFLQIAFGSSVELLHHLITSLDLAFLTQEEFDRLDRANESVRRMLVRLMNRLREADRH
jgi:four helix bundle protein